MKAFPLYRPRLTGLVSLGSDAVADTEALYNGEGRS